MAFYNCVSADIYEAAVAAYPADRATLNHRRRKVAEHRLQQSHGLCWGTAESLSCVPDNTGIPECMGVALLLLYLQFLLLKWRKHKGTHPTASRYASHCAAVYGRISARVHRVYRRKKRALLRKAFHLRLWCLVYYWLAYGKLMRTIMTCKRKLVRTIDRGYMKVTFSIYRRLPSLGVSAAVIFLGLFMSGDIELNPGPKQSGQLTIDDLKVVRSTLWEVRTSWKSIGIELDIKVSSLDAIAADYSGKTEDCFTEMLALWLKQVDPMPNWSTIVAALKQPTVGQHEVAVRAEKLQCTEGKAGSASAIHKLAFPHIKEMINDESTSTNLEEKLRVESKIIIQSFHILRFKFIDSLEKQRVPVEKLQKYLKDEINDPLLSGKSTCFEDIENVIRKYTSFFDYQLINYMIKLAGTDEDKESLKEYETDFTHYAQRRVYECPTVFGNPDTTASELHIKLDSKYDEYTLNELKEFQYRLCLKLNVSVYVCRLLSIEKGCILAIFLIPPTDRDSKFPLSRDQEKDLMEFGIQNLICGEYKFQATDMECYGQDVVKPVPKSSISDSGVGTSVVTDPSDDPQLFLDENALIDSADNLLYNYTKAGKLDSVKDLVERQNYDPSQLSDSGNSALHYAAGSGRLNVLKYFVEDRLCSHSVRGHIWQTPLHMATLYGHFHVVEYLVTTQHVDPLNSDLHNRSALHYACIGGNEQVLRFLIKSIEYVPIEQFIRDKTKNGYTFLHLAAKHGKLTILKCLIDEFNCDPCAIRNRDKTILHKAAESGHEHVVRYLIDSSKCDKLCKDKRGNTPLHLASSKGHLNIVRYLTLDKKCIPTVRNFNNDSPLHLAALNGHINIISFLVHELECDINLIGHKHRTPLHLAALHGNMDTVKFIMKDSHCLPECRDYNNRTPVELAELKGHTDVATFFHNVQLYTLTEVGDIGILQTFIIYCKGYYVLDLQNSLSIAAQNGHCDIVKYLVEKQHCDPTWEDEDKNSSLHLACSEGHLEVVKFLTSNGCCDPMFKNSDGITLLHNAALNGYLHIIKYLVEEKHCDPSCGDRHHNITPLYAACVKGHIEVVKYLALEKCCDPMCKNIHDNTPLHVAALNGHFEVVKFLTSQMKCDPRVLESKSYRTPLHNAALEDHLDIVKYLIEEMNCDPSCEDGEKMTPLYLACMRGHIQTVKYLSLDRGCDPMYRDRADTTPLHVAALNGHIEVVKFFTSEMMCDPNVLGWVNDGTPLHNAAMDGHVDIVKYLIEEKNCDPSCENDDKMTPLYVACMRGHIQTVKYLSLDRGCDPMCRDRAGTTPLHVAALNGHIEVVKFLTSKMMCDSSVLKLSNDRTPLHEAALNGHLDIVEYLVEEKHCDPSCKDEDKRTPLYLASMNGHIQVVKCLSLALDISSDPVCRDSDNYENRTPLHVAALNGHLDIVKYLVEEKHCDPSCEAKNKVHDSSSSCCTERTNRDSQIPYFKQTL